MKGFIVFVSFFIVCSLFTLTSAQSSGSSCIPCGGQWVASSTNSAAPPYAALQPTQKYVPGWQDFGEGSKGCYWCKDPYTQGQNCIPLPRYVQSSCDAAAKCNLADTALKMLVVPLQTTNQAGCLANAPKWFWYNITAWDNLKCGCENAYIGRDDPNYQPKKVALSEAEFKVISEKYPVETRQATPDCFTSLLCDPSTGRTDCSNATVCPQNRTENVYYCADIRSSNQSCPGYYASPYGNNTCPMKAGPKCGICNSPDRNATCTGKYSNTAICPQFGVCLECHVITLASGKAVCGAHMAVARDRCYCAPQVFYTNNTACNSLAARAEFGIRQNGTSSYPYTSQYATSSSSASATSGNATSATSITSSASSSASSASSSASSASSSSTSSTTNTPPSDPSTQQGAWMCAPWGQDIMTVNCIVGTNQNAGWATVADCQAGRAILPTACEGTWHCGGHICGSVVGSQYTQFP